MAQNQIHKELKRFGANLRYERTARNITQEKLAELACLNVRTIQKIEAGQTNILITTANLIVTSQESIVESVIYWYYSMLSTYTLKNLIKTDRAKRIHFIVNRREIPFESVEANSPREGQIWDSLSELLKPDKELWAFTTIVRCRI